MFKSSWSPDRMIFEALWRITLPTTPKRRLIRPILGFNFGCNSFYHEFWTDSDALNLGHRCLGFGWLFVGFFLILGPTFGMGLLGCFFLWACSFCANFCDFLSIWCRLYSQIILVIFYWIGFSVSYVVQKKVITYHVTKIWYW